MPSNPAIAVNPSLLAWAREESGYALDRIAKRLNVTERTVKAHLTAIFRKLGLSGRLQLALFALEHGRSAREPEPIGPRFN